MHANNISIVETSKKQFKNKFYSPTGTCCRGSRGHLGTSGRLQPHRNFRHAVHGHGSGRPGHVLRGRARERAVWYHRALHRPRCAKYVEWLYRVLGLYILDTKKV